MNATYALGLSMAAPATHPHADAICGRCVKCHPGRQFGGDEYCVRLKKNETCPCHQNRK